jgi:hypothetical protein
MELRLQVSRVVAQPGDRDHDSAAAGRRDRDNSASRTETLDSCNSDRDNNYPSYHAGTSHVIIISVPLAV